MTSMLYVGMSEKLKGRRALVQRVPGLQISCKAQFNFPEGVSTNDPDFKPENYPECFGWHFFVWTDFKE